jgi:hypothetical protein
MNVRDYNCKAWDREVERGNQWTIAVGPETVAAAKQGQWEIVLTPIVSVLVLLLCGNSHP